MLVGCSAAWAHLLFAGTMLIGGVVYGRFGETASACFDEGAAVAGFGIRWSRGVFWCRFGLVWCRYGMEWCKDSRCVMPTQCYIP